MKLQLSDLKVCWYWAIQEANRWRRPIRSFWNESIKSYLYKSIKERNKIKQSLEITNHHGRAN